jgi:hypothetical protein
MTMKTQLISLRAAKILCKHLNFNQVHPILKEPKTSEKPHLSRLKETENKKI